MSFKYKDAENLKLTGCTRAEDSCQSHRHEAADTEKHVDTVCCVCWSLSPSV